jgi:hypothetical protein
MGGNRLPLLAAFLLAVLLLTAGCATSDGRRRSAPPAGLPTTGLPATGLPPAAITVLLTPATSGRTISVQLGQMVRVETQAAWHIAVGSGPANPVEFALPVSLQRQATGPDGMEWALFRAVRVGPSVVRAGATAGCGQPSPQCAARSGGAVLTVDVHPAPRTGAGPRPVSNLGLVSGSRRS